MPSIHGRRCAGTPQLTQKYSAADALSRAEQGMADVTAQHQQELRMLLQQLADVVGSKLAVAAATPGQRAVVSRYERILSDWRTDVERAATQLQRAVQRHELLGGAAGAAATASAGENDAATDSLLRERNHIANSMTAAASVIGQAEAVRGDLHGQGRSLRNSSGLVGQIASNVPGLNTLMEHISRRRSRDDKIVAGVTASCLVFILWYVLG